ncbi:NAD(P)-dependent oxidoreductase [Abyssibius alkaniclasticus]|uniref:NAD(P)-dependent oxidoreductase n=1 Tax=Abyssibius alkaniclasticus TaxID=2881234 RepID=UPI00405809B8
MRHFPIFLDLRARRVIVGGAGECALAKLRLLVKTEAQIVVFGHNAVEGVVALAEAGQIALHDRAPLLADFAQAALGYAAYDDDEADAAFAALAHGAGVLLNVVDNLEASAFITPAIVDRDPVVVAIGTEGAAPVLARQIKADLEQRLPETLGRLARLGQGFRAAAQVLAPGRARRDFWARFYGGAGDAALAAGGTAAAQRQLGTLLREVAREAAPAAHVDFIPTSAPDLLTLRAQRKLHGADIVVHDAGVAPEILELARREAQLVAVLHDKADLVALAAGGAQVARLVAGDAPHPLEVARLRNAGLSHSVLPSVGAPTQTGFSAEIHEVRRHG